MKYIAGFLAGECFALGLAVSGMTDPGRVLGFLRLDAKWDPRLMIVMAGAIAVFAPLYRLTLRRGKPIFADGFTLPTMVGLDRRLLLGSAIFGAGWGLAGYCPGPALVSLGSGSLAATFFVVAMTVGMLVVDKLTK